MKSSAVGKNISKQSKLTSVEVLSVSPHGLWLYAAGREYLLTWKDHPWFAQARIAEIFHVQLLHGMHLHWPDLDVDLHLDSLEHPERFPLVSKRR